MGDLANVVSRVLMSSIFIVDGYLRFVHVSTTFNGQGTKRLMEMVASGAPAPRWFGYLIPAVEVIGGVAILLGVKTRFVALALALYVAAATYLGHPFWLLEGAARANHQVHFYKNLAIIGGFLLLACAGGGRYSVDRR